MTFESGDIFAENYQLVKPLGAGSFGEVWLAKNRIADINVAIKFYTGLDQHGVDDFKEEFKLAYRLSHPNLLHLNHFDVYNQCPYLVMPYCPNGSSALLRGNVSETRVWEFIRDVSAGLAYLHAQNPPILHQDIKLGNILIDENGRFIVTDFGISKKIEYHMQTLRSVKMESSGTIAYMSPERLKTPPVMVKAGDMWSLGMSVYELVTGQVLWELGGLMQLGGAEVPSLGGNYSSQLSRFVQSCLSMNAWERPTAQQAYGEAKAKLNGSTPVPITSSVQSPSYYHVDTSSHFRSDYSYSSHNPNKKVGKTELTLWKKYSEMIKWAGGAIFLFIFALCMFYMIFQRDDNPVELPKVNDNMIVKDEIIANDTAIVDSQRVVEPIIHPSPYNHPKPKPKPSIDTPAPKPIVVNRELELWNKCERERTKFLYNEYVRRYPKGRFVNEAKKRMRDIDKKYMPSKNVVY